MTASQKTSDHFEADMKLSIGKSFGPSKAEVAAGGGVSNGTTTADASTFQNDIFLTEVSAVFLELMDSGNFPS